MSTNKGLNGLPIFKPSLEYYKIENSSVSSTIIRINVINF